MAVPKRKVSKSKCRIRKMSHKTSVPAVQTCSECGALQQSHRVCPSCGTYRGRKVIAAEIV